MTESGRTILIYNPLAGHGHLDSWNALVVSFLLERGDTVLALTPEPAELLRRLGLLGLRAHPRLALLRWPNIKPAFWQRVFNRLAGMAPFLFASKAQEPSHDPENNYLEPSEFAQRIQAALQDVSTTPDFMFNMYMDLYRTDKKRWQVFSQLCSLPWAGLRFIPQSIPLEGYYKTPSLRGIALIDEKLAAAYQKQLPQLVIGYLPDMADVLVGNDTSHIAQAIVTRAQGRKIVFMGGTIGKNKNLACWYTLIKKADADKWFFVQIGEVLANDLTQEDRNACQIIDLAPPENLYRHIGYLPDERDFNAAIAVADIIYAVYRDFKISSNMLGKAAAFDKPIVVAQEHLMGERVRAYQIGIAVPENAPSAALEALKALVEQPVDAKYFEAYRSDFSTVAFKNSFFQFIDACQP